MFSSHLLKRVKKFRKEIEEDNRRKDEKVKTAEIVTAEKIRRIFENQQKQIASKEEEIPVIIKGIKAQLELIESSEPQKLREIFVNVKRGINLIEKRLTESSELFELFHAKREEEMGKLEEEKKKIKQEQGPSRRQQVTEL